jgi:hypothetical protein
MACVVDGPILIYDKNSSELLAVSGFPSLFDCRPNTTNALCSQLRKRVSESRRACQAPNKSLQRTPSGGAAEFQR